MAKAVASIAHRAPQRLRVTVPSRRGDPAFFDRLTRSLRDESAIEGGSANPVTGSVIVRHPDGAEPMDLLRRAFDLIELEDDEPPPRANSETEADSYSAWAWALSGLAVVQAAQGHVVGHATENFWHAYGSQRLLSNNTLTLGFAALGVSQLLAGNVLGSASSLLFYSLVLRRIAEADREHAPENGASQGKAELESGIAAP